VWNSIDPKPVGQKPGEAMYLGMHYINNVCLCFKSGSPEYETAKKYQNCFLVDEGSVKAFKKIYPDGVFLWYTAKMKMSLGRKVEVVEWTAW
jgi:hypothetical protein